MLSESAGSFALWDVGIMHEDRPILSSVDHLADRVNPADLPPYTPMLTPVVSPWSWLKMGAAEQISTLPRVSAVVDWSARSPIRGFTSK